MIFTYPGVGQLTCKLYRDDWCTILLSLFIILLGLLVLFLFFEDYEINCQDKKPSLAMGCVLKVRVFNIYKNTEYIGQLQGAKVVRTKSASKRGPLYSVILLTDKGELRISSSSSNIYSTHLNRAEAINQYIVSSDKKQFRVPHVYDLSDFVVILGVGLCFFVGLYGLFYTNVILIFNKNTNSLIVRKKNIFKSNDTVFALPDIEEIVLQEQIASKWMAALDFLANFNKNKAAQDNHVIPPSNIYPSSLKKKQTQFKAIVEQDNKLRSRGTRYRLVLVLKYDTLFVLTPPLSDGFFELKKSVNQINSFINFNK